MPIVGTHQAKTHLSSLIRLVEQGEPVMILRGSVPVAMLVRIGATPLPRRAGSLRESLRMDPALDGIDPTPEPDPKRRGVPRPDTPPLRKHNPDTRR